ncbi:DUF1850 domain-containing protein [Oceanobacillus kimchii]|uniref:DUF1850 domain-containing protein n=1 Tax=Oceanobacillus kimchii TaxID=746691 RepID=UPI000348A8B4|nr:DUF1850 domain-containing protein [Oceanobacillus kimchii]MCT1577920.1 DUF1850 domain-containing protein [Oceanobacillus kimchii]MCT2137480.1 DUF1850 domain-containing protein [Oceanobacillus kimchii]
MKSKNKWIVGGAITVVLLFFLFNKVTVVEVGIDGRSYYIHDREFELKWIHSVEKEEWVEVYKINENKLSLIETYFKTFGAGVPAQGEVIPSSDGYIHMKMDVSYKELNIAVSENVKTTLSTDKKDVHLYKLTENYNNVVLTVKELFIWKVWEGEIL